jgi:hypothetical protein
MIGARDEAELPLDSSHRSDSRTRHPRKKEGTKKPARKPDYTARERERDS